MTSCSIVEVEPLHDMSGFRIAGQRQQVVSAPPGPEACRQVQVPHWPVQVPLHGPGNPYERFILCSYKDYAYQYEIELSIILGRT